MSFISLFKRLPFSANHEDDNTTPANSQQQKGVIDEDVEEGFSYKTTRCLSSYYSIFVARLAIMVMLAILIGMLTMLTWHFTKIYTADSVNSLAYGLRYELLQRPILRMWNILNSTTEITLAQVKLSEYVIGSYYNPEAQEQRPELYVAMKDITWAVFASRKALNAIIISYRNGFVQAFHRDRRSNNTYYIYSEHVNSSRKSIWYEEPLDPSTGKKIGDAREIPPDDLIDVAGVSDVRDGTASWHVTVSKFTDSPLLSAALPVRHPSGGSIVAAVGVTTALKSVGQLMRELVDFHSGYMYLTSREGYLLATSTDAPLLRNSTNGLKLMLAKDSEDPMISGGAEWLEKQYGDKFPMSHEVHAENVILGHQRYYIDSFFLNLKRLPLVGVIIIPRKYIMGKVDHLGVTTSIILIAASICLLTIGCVCIFILTSGVSKAMKLKAELIKHLDARRRAEASSNYKSQFLANMSHELRTPMAAVIGLLDILIYDDSLTNEQYATITQIRKCSTALLRLLNNILDLSKVESGKLVLEEAEFDLGRELEGIVATFSVQRMNHNIETVLDLSDCMPKVVRGDSARIVQIFTNLISNSMKFTSEGYVILRGWSERSKSSTMPIPTDDHGSIHPTIKIKSKQQNITEKRVNKKNDSVTLWFEVEDTGCGIDPNKWETVFESFEQADPSTTRKHGGTGLGLCIVRNLVNKMEGEIEVVEKDGPGTLMRLCLVLGMPKDGQQHQTDIKKHDFKVLLALSGNKGRFVISQWLRENGVSTWEASEWNDVTSNLQQIFPKNVLAETIVAEGMPSEPRMDKESKRVRGPKVITIVEAGLLDQSTNIWKKQLTFLDNYSGKTKFAWVVDQDTSNAFKVELRRRGHFLMINKPLYKTKIIQILETVVKENQRTKNSETSKMSGDWHECHEIDPIKLGTISSDDENQDSIRNRFCVQEKLQNPDPLPHIEPTKKGHTTRIDESSIFQNCHYKDEAKKFSSKIKHPIDGQQESKTDGPGKYDKQNCASRENLQDQAQLGINTVANDSRACLDFPPRHHDRQKQTVTKDHQSEIISFCETVDITSRYPRRKYSGAAIGSKLHAGGTHQEHGVHLLTNEYTTFNQDQEQCACSNKLETAPDSLRGLHILLAEDNPILQRVATTMLEKVGARVRSVGDGEQAVDAIKSMLNDEEHRIRAFAQQNEQSRLQKQMQGNSIVHLILMDCQMPKLDGYEATKAIRRLEEGTGLHIPIVALTAHAMSSDEAKCLGVGMDAYLTKPIDCKLMVSTILSLTK